MIQNAVLYQFIDAQGTFSCDSKIHSAKNKQVPKYFWTAVDTYLLYIMYAAKKNFLFKNLHIITVLSGCLKRCEI